MPNPKDPVKLAEYRKKLSESQRKRYLEHPEVKVVLREKMLGNKHGLGYRHTNEGRDRMREKRIAFLRDNPDYKGKLREWAKNWERKGEKNPLWKGDNVGYGGFHRWVREHKPKPDTCEFCGEKKRLDLAKMSENYTRNSEDYKYLCRRCHFILDGNIKNLELGRKRCSNG